MSSVWEKVRYVEILPEKEKTTLEVTEVIRIILNEFSQKYQHANFQKIEPNFYIGNSI